MKEKLEYQIKCCLKNLICRYPQLNSISDILLSVYECMVECYEQEGKMLIAGNGGSAADSEHLAAELMKRFCVPRPISSELTKRIIEIADEHGEEICDNLERALLAIPLGCNKALLTAYINDVGSDCIYGQELLAYGKKNDIFLGISTSGNSRNVLDAAIVAKAMGLKVIALTGGDGGRLTQIADIVVRVPEKETYLIQELHLPIYHCWCRMLELHFFGE